MAAANDFDGFDDGAARGGASGVVSRFMSNQPSYSTFDEEARIRRRDSGYLEQDRLQALVLIGGFAASALLLFIAGFVSAFLLFDDIGPADVAVSEPPPVETPAVVAPPVIASAEPPPAAADDPVDFPAGDFVGSAQADAQSDLPPAPAPEIAAVRALNENNVAVDAPGNPVVPVQPVVNPQPEVFSQSAEPDTPVQLVRTAPESSLQLTNPPPVTRGFVLQFGAFGDKANAEGLAALLKQKVGRVWIVEGKASSGADLFFVRGGSFESRDDAAAAARKLWQSDRIDSFVRSVERG